MRTTLLVGLPEGFYPPPELAPDNEAPVVFGIDNDDVADLVVRILTASVGLGYATIPSLTPPNPDWPPSPLRRKESLFSTGGLSTSWDYPHTHTNSSLVQLQSTYSATGWWFNRLTMNGFNPFALSLSKGVPIAK
jgi:hypothetical protein